MDEQDDIKTGEGPRPDDDRAGPGPARPTDDDTTPEPLDVSELSQEADNIAEELREAGESVDPVEEPPSEGAELPQESPDGGSDAPELSGEDNPPEMATDFLPAPDAPPPPPEAVHDIPEQVQQVEAVPPAPGEMDAIQGDMQNFGEQVDAFNAAGGVEGGAADDLEIGGPGGDKLSDTDGPLSDFTTSSVGFAQASYEFLRDHSRSLNDIVRQLEIERL